MKNVKLRLLLAAFCIVMSISMKAQDKANDYFVGRWSVLVVGTPNGDSKMPLKLTQVDGKLQGGIEDAKGDLATKFDKVEVKGNTMTVYFVGGGYNCYITLDKKDDTTAVGSLMDMFDATATRVVEAEKK
jgi:hypothetical protein